MYSTNNNRKRKKIFSGQFPNKFLHDLEETTCRWNVFFNLSVWRRETR